MSSLLDPSFEEKITDAQEDIEDEHFIDNIIAPM